MKVISSWLSNVKIFELHSDENFKFNLNLTKIDANT